MGIQRGVGEVREDGEGGKKKRKDGRSDMSEGVQEREGGNIGKERAQEREVGKIGKERAQEREEGKRERAGEVGRKERGLWECRFQKVLP